MVIKFIKYLVEISMVFISALPVLFPKRFHYLEKRVSKFCCFIAVAVLFLCIADDITSSRRAKLSAKNASNRIANVEKNNLELQTTLKQERADRLALEHKMEKREITADQRVRLLAFLKDGPKGIVYLRPKSFDVETEQYSKQIAGVLKEAGFDVRESVEATLSWSLTGAFLLVKNLKNLPPHALFVQNAFRAVDIMLPAYNNSDVPDKSIMIGIGERF